MFKKRRRFSPEHKFRVALDVAKGQEALSELASKYEFHPNQMAAARLANSQWKLQPLAGGA